MSGACDRERIEALAMGECESDEARALTAHAMGCDACRAELGALRKERALFEARTRRTEATAMANIWDKLEPRLGRDQEPRKSRVALWGGGLVAAAAALLLVLHGVGPVHLPVGAATPGATVPAKVLRTDDDPFPAAKPSHGGEHLLKVFAAGTTPRVKIVTTAGKVTVEAAATKEIQVRIDVEGVDDDARSARWTLEAVETLPGMVSVHVRCDGLLCGNAPDASITVSLPANAEIIVDAISADVDTTGLRGPQVVHTVSGDIDLEDCAAVSVHTTSGAVTLDGGSGASEIDTVSGDVQWSMSGAKRACGRGCAMKINTVSGGVNLALVDDSAFTLRYQSVSGTVEGELDEAWSGGEHSGQIRVKDGLAQVSVTSVSGDLSLARE